MSSLRLSSEEKDLGWKTTERAVQIGSIAGLCFAPGLMLLQKGRRPLTATIRRCVIVGPTLGKHRLNTNIHSFVDIFRCLAFVCYYFIMCLFFNFVC